MVLVSRPMRLHVDSKKYTKYYSTTFWCFVHGFLSTHATWVQLYGFILFVFGKSCLLFWVSLGSPGLHPFFTPDYALNFPIFLITFCSLVWYTELVRPVLQFLAQNFMILSEIAPCQRKYFLNLFIQK